MTSLGLKYHSFVEITQEAIKRREKLGKLATILITKRSDLLATQQFVKINNVLQARELFGHGSVSRFASNYFTFTNRGGDSPDELYVFTWAKDKAVTPTLVGGDTPALEDLKKINGKFALTLDSTQKTITINLTSKNSHTDIASELTTAIKKDNSNVNGFKDTEVKWSSIYNAFILKAGAGVKTISFLQSPSDGTDVSGKLGLSSEEGARIVEPYPQIQKIEDALETISLYNDSYFFITFDFEFDNFNVDLPTIGSWVHEQAGDYCILYMTSQAGMTTQYNFTSKIKKYNGLAIEYSAYPAQTNGKSAGIMSSVDYSKTQGNINISFTSVPEFIDFSIKEKKVYDLITEVDNNRANTFTTAKRMDAGTTWYMPGNIMGSDSIYLNVYIASFVIKTLLQQGFTSWFTLHKFPSTSDGELILQTAENIMDSVKSIGLITTAQDLTPDERLEISSKFSSVPNVAKGLATSGYYLEIGGFDSKKRCVNLNLAYVANVPIRKICIRIHTLRGDN